MRIALRCDRHRHAFYDPDEQILEIHCRKCSKEAGKPVYHRWRVKDGVLIGADDPSPIITEHEPALS